MAITVITEVTNGNTQKKNAGITAGNEFIYKVDPAKAVEITGVATSTGDARVFFSTDPDLVPTDFALANGMIGSSLGVLTDYIGENLGKGIVWVGLDITGGTWTGNIKEL